MNTAPLQDIINRSKNQRNNSPYLSSCKYKQFYIKFLGSSSKRQSVVISSNSHYSSESNNKAKPDDKTIQQLYNLFKKQGFDNVNGLLKFLELYKTEQTHPKKSQSPILRQDPIDRTKFSQMINEAKQGLNKLESRINTFSNKTDVLKYKHLLTEDDENHEYLYENRQKQTDYKALYQKAVIENQALNKRIDKLVEDNIQRDGTISSLQEEINAIKNQLSQMREQNNSPRPSISESDYTFTLNVCNSDVRQDIGYKDVLHTQSQQIKRM